MDSPPELLPYLVSNTPLPNEFKPTLGTYLAQASNFISELDAEIDQLERALDAKRRKREQYQRGYEEHYRIQSPTRSFPPEIWGVIFSFTLGDEPFGTLEYRTYGYLREVCLTWRDVVPTTPDLCRGLVVHLDGPLTQGPNSDDKGTRCIKHNLEPWLAIVSRNHPYQLVLGTEADRPFDNPDGVDGLCEWIFTTTPTPTILSIAHSYIFSSVYALAPRGNKISHLTLEFWHDLDREVFTDMPFQEVFPYLNTLVVDTPIKFLSDLSHTNIQSLTLTDVCGSATEFATFLRDLPLLRELRIDSKLCCRPPANPSNPSTTIVHPALEILVADGEDLLLILAYITFPSLKYFGVKAWGSYEDHDSLSEIVPAFIKRCSLDNSGFTFSLKGKVYNFVFNLLMHNIPHGTRLHLDVDVELGENAVGEKTLESATAATWAVNGSFAEIFCTQKLVDLHRLRGDRNHSRGSELVKLYMPNGALAEEEIEMERDNLLEGGHILEVLQPHEYNRLLRSSIPQTTLGWEV
ncbi:hypothetical protein BKA70DRAFT_1220830 [Coprinopsis sp. MPI-PUGE-AT-0042]|nr:hypothetical protein BKA70DRAFT_1220830 [Coprinopsis sp. MPI-PUGE-AT-0042]